LCDSSIRRVQCRIWDDNVQFTKAPNVLRGMGLTHLAKNEKAKKELAEKGMALE
jgi:hypothetical protein